MKLCACLKCGGVFEDPIAPVDAPDYPDNLKIKPLERFRDEIEYDGDRKNTVWACPVCATNAYLSDEVSPDKINQIYGS